MKRRNTLIGRVWTVLATLAVLSLVAGACGDDDAGGDAFDSSDAAVGSEGSVNPDTDRPDEATNEDSADEDVDDPSTGDPSSDGSADDRAADHDDDAHPDVGGDDGIAIPQGHEGFCGDFYEFLQATIDLLDVYFDGDPATLEAAGGPVREAMATLEDSAPVELLADLELANQYFVTMLDTLEAHDYDVEAANADPAMSTERTGEAARAEETLHNYVVDECDYDPEAIGLSPPG